jgi:hypothetical protein
MSGSLHFTASGGDPLTAAQIVAIFESFETRRAEHGDNAHPTSPTTTSTSWLEHEYSISARTEPMRRQPDRKPRGRRGLRSEDSAEGRRSEAEP